MYLSRYGYTCLMIHYGHNDSALYIKLYIVIYMPPSSGFGTVASRQSWYSPRPSLSSPWESRASSSSRGAAESCLSERWCCDWLGPRDTLLDWCPAWQTWDGDRIHASDCPRFPYLYPYFTSWWPLKPQWSGWVFGWWVQWKREGAWHA